MVQSLNCCLLYMVPLAKTLQEHAKQPLLNQGWASNLTICNASSISSIRICHVGLCDPIIM